MYDKEKKENRYEPKKSESKFLLDEDGKKYFLEDKGSTIYIYTFLSEKIAEIARIVKKDNNVDMIINSDQGFGIRYDYYNNKTLITQFVQDSFDATKQDILLHQEFVDEKLILEKDYKKDFKTTKEQMLKDLANNFFNSPTNYMKENKEGFIIEDEELLERKMSVLKQDIKEAVNTKNDFYKKIKINKHYYQDSQPVYDVTLPFDSSQPSPRDYWNLRIDGVTNTVLDVKLITLIE